MPAIPSHGNLVLVIDTDTAVVEVVHSIIKYLQMNKKVRNRVEQIIFLGNCAMPVPLMMHDEASSITNKVIHKHKPQLIPGASPEANIFFLRGMLEGLSGNTMRLHILNTIYNSPVAHLMSFIGMAPPKARNIVVVSATPGLATANVNWNCAVAALKALGATVDMAREIADAAWVEARMLAGCQHYNVGCCPSERERVTPTDDEHSDDDGTTPRTRNDLQAIFTSLLTSAGSRLG
jgi:hypothetical protein